MLSYTAPYQSSPRQPSVVPRQPCSKFGLLARILPTALTLDSLTGPDTCPSWRLEIHLKFHPFLLGVELQARRRTGSAQQTDTDTLVRFGAFIKLLR